MFVREQLTGFSSPIMWVLGTEASFQAWQQVLVPTGHLKVALKIFFLFICVCGGAPVCPFLKRPEEYIRSPDAILKAGVS